MRLGYLTTDHVNLELAHGLAEESGVTLYPLSYEETLEIDGLDAALYDWDFLPVGWREELFVELREGASACPIAVHSYHVQDGPLKELRRKGVALFRRLGREVFAELRRRRAPSRPAVR